MNRKVSILWLIISAFIILSGFFSGRHFYKELKKELETQITENELLITQSQIKQDSLINIAEGERNFADQLRRDNEQLTRRNNSLYYQLKQRNAQIFIIDTSFIYNARRIKSSVNRFIEENDTTQ